MAQRLKEEVRDRIVEAAAAVFAERGYSAAKLADMADRAGISTSNIYKYFDNKEALFDEIVTVPIAAELLRRLRTRIRDIGRLEQWGEADAAGSASARALLSFWVDNRLAVLILLRGAEGTRFGHVRGLMTREMERLSTRYILKRQDRPSLTPVARFVLHRMFARTVDMVADILAAHAEPSAIQQAFAIFWRYQLAGLEALMKTDPRGSPL
ncbi:MAG: TetR/AcrR family transcriptional regulator [Rhizobiaceae bacterium]|nr:TetR/AcrR family transcriptional regulator [Rhizobiaceae bacterium]